MADTKGVIIRMIAVTQIVEGTFALVSAALLIARFYTPEARFMIPAAIAILFCIGMMVLGVAVLKHRRWAVWASIFPVAIPVALLLAIPGAAIPLFGSVWGLALNTVIAIYLLGAHRKKAE